MNDGPRGCWTESQIKEGKEEDQEEPEDRIYKQRWNGEICIVEIGKIENYGMQDAENGDSCKKTRFIYKKSNVLQSSINVSRTGPLGLQEVDTPNIPKFQDNRHLKVTRLSALGTGHLYPPGETPVISVKG